MSERDGLTPVGNTTGLAVQTCDKATHRIEQVLVYTVEGETHPILIEGWVGYEIPERMRLTKRQATDLIGLLAQAVAS
jgi:hypothetical protein